VQEKRPHVPVRHLDAGQHPAEVGARIRVVEQADVPAAAEGPEEFQQGAGLLGKLDPVQALVLHARRQAAHHVPHVQFRYLVVAEV
jgi:hypothetical protein